MTGSPQGDTGGIISRRTVLGGGVAVGATAALAGVAPAAADTHLAITGAVRVGATFDLFPFKAGTTYAQAVRLWNETTRTSMRCWKVYYQLGQFPVSIDARLETIISHGIQALVSFKPAVDTRSAQAEADKARLGAAVRMFHHHGLRAEICLWQEVGPKDMTAKQYHKYVAYYGPVIREFYPLVFDAPGYQGPAQWSAYDPGRHLLDGYAVDFYCGDYINHGVKLDEIMDLAGPLPVGIWEIGNTASPRFVPTAAEVKEYMGYITRKLTQRLARGLPVGSVAWYNGPATASQSGQNEMVGAHPCLRAAADLTAYRALYAAINGKVPS